MSRPVLFEILATGLVLAVTHAQNVPLCGSSSQYGSTHYVSDGTADRRCFSMISPPSDGLLPVLFWFHGAGGNAKDCGRFRPDDNGDTLDVLAVKHGFALVCGEALQNVYGKGGQWAIPEVMTEVTGPRCDLNDTQDNVYVHNVINFLNATGKYDATRIFTSGCSMGSAFSEHIGHCMYRWAGPGEMITAFATHSTGLKIKGDGLRFPPDNYNKSIPWGECDACQYFPTVPRATPGLKLCLFDNTEDPTAANPFFYESTLQMATRWNTFAANRVEHHYGSGGHCTIHSFSDIIVCLDDGTHRLLPQFVGGPRRTQTVNAGA